MNGLQDIDVYREDARRELRRLLDATRRSNSEILRHQLARSRDEALFPAALCLGVAGCLGAPGSRALACAGATGFLVLALEVVTDSARIVEWAQPANTFVPSWSLPLILNAGDGLFSLAHSAILDVSAPNGGLDTASAGLALAILDEASLSVAEAVRLHLADGRNSNSGDLSHASQVPFARLGASLGGISADVSSDESIACLAAYGEAIATARANLGAASVGPSDAITGGVRDAVEMLRRARLPAAATDALLALAAAILGKGSS